MGFDGRQEFLNGAGRHVEPGTSRWGDPIGMPLEDMRRRLLTIAGQLEHHLDDHALPLLLEAKRLMQERTCRIAVIGQIKAGKSTFINALTRRPSLLPTDINPWTAVVTLLHFRDGGPPPEHAAVFHLFSADEWKNLADGGGRLRELTERLIPDFQPELLRAQLEVMRQRAERRLGPQFHELLGQQHPYSEISHELLSDYISAGDYDDNPTGTRRRLYSDITRTAELFFSEGPFSFPVTLIDTPGTNDPFLVRDEITRRALENPDIYIFVISAVQPLSAADISMLRLLNGLHKDRIIVFINRTDQLTDPAAEITAITADVAKRLKIEFPALEIPIIAGSAWWANLSLQADTIDAAAFLRPSSAAFLRGFGLPASFDPSAKPLPPADRARLAEALYAGSGLPAVSAIITRFMKAGGGAQLLRQLAACFLEFAKSAEVSARMERGFVLELLDARHSEAHTTGARIKQERDNLSLLASRAYQLRQCFDQVEGQLKDIIGASTARMRGDLCYVVDEFAAGAGHQMTEAMRRSSFKRSWTCDVMPLRDRLERGYVDAFRQIAHDFAEIEHALQPQLRALIESLLPGYSANYVEPNFEHAEPYPSVAPLSDTVVLDLDMSWWRLWFAARPDPGQRAADLERLIKEDFYPMVDELVREAQAEFAGRIGRSLHGGTSIGDSLLHTIESRSADLLTEYEALNSTTTQASQEHFEAEQRNQAAHCSERQAACAAFIEELGRLLGYFQTGSALEGQKP